MRPIVLAALAVLAGLTGCAQLLGGKAEIPQRREFIIIPLPVEVPLEGSERPYPYRVQINEIQVPPRYERNQIVFRLSEYELKKDRVHTWSARPSEMLTDAIEAYFVEARLFTLTSRDFLTTPDFTLSGTVQAIERFDSGDEWRARLAMSLKLVDEKDKSVFWEASFDDELVVFNKDMSYAVENLNEILRERMREYLGDIDFKLGNRMRQARGETALSARPQEAAPAGADTSAAPEAVVRPRDGSDYLIFPGKRMPAGN